MSEIDTSASALQELAEELHGTGTCPYCNLDPYHYVDNGVGMEPVAVVCCEAGIEWFQHGREPDEPETPEYRAAATLRALAEQAAPPSPLFISSPSDEAEKMNTPAPAGDLVEAVTLAMQRTIKADVARLKGGSCMGGLCTEGSCKCLDDLATAALAAIRAAGEAGHE